MRRNLEKILRNVKEKYIEREKSEKKCKDKCE